MKTRHAAHHVPVTAVRATPGRLPYGIRVVGPTYAGAMATIERADGAADFTADPCETG